MSLSTSWGANALVLFAQGTALVHLRQCPSGLLRWSDLKDKTLFPFFFHFIFRLSSQSVKSITVDLHCLYSIPCCSNYASYWLNPSSQSITTQTWSLKMNSLIMSIKVRFSSVDSETGVFCFKCVATQIHDHHHKRYRQVQLHHKNITQLQVNFWC